MKKIYKYLPMMFNYCQQKDAYSAKLLQVEDVSVKLLKTRTKSLHNARKSFPERENIFYTRKQYELESRKETKSHIMYFNRGICYTGVGGLGSK